MIVIDGTSNGSMIRGIAIEFTAEADIAGIKIDPFGIDIVTS